MPVVLYELDENTEFDAIRIDVDEEITSVRFEGGARNGPRNNGTVFPISAYANTRRSGFGVHCRGVSVGWISDVPEGYDPKGILFIPVLRPFRFNQIRAGTTLTYRDGTAIILGKRPEILR